MARLEHDTVRDITDNALIAALYYGLTVLAILVPAVSQFGMIQCRIAEALALVAFFRPKLTIGLTIGCLLANLTGALAGMNMPIDILFGTMATLIACLLEAYASPFLFIAALYPVLINGVIVGLEIYFLFNDTAMPLLVCMGWVALGELIALAIGYALFLLLIRNKAFMNVFKPTRHATVRF